MTIVLVGLGSRGDVQPLTALATRLVARGERVRVVALEEYAGLAASSGAEFLGVPGSIADALDDRRRNRLVAATQGGQLWLLHRWTGRLAPAFADALLDAIRPGDCVVTGILTRGSVAALAATRGVRMATVAFTGQLPTVHPASNVAHSYYTGAARHDRRGSVFGWRLATALGGPLTATVRARLGLARSGPSAVTAGADEHPVLLAASPVLVPPAPDWPANAVQTGWWAPAASDVTPDPAFDDWLRGEPPVHVGFGSFTGFATDADVDLIVRAAKASGRRVVTPALPGREPGQLSELVWATGPVPHAWLFPRMAGVIHHGGAGTTHAALAAGIPQAMVPFGVDQPYHAWRVRRLELGPEPVSIQRLTAGRLGRLIRLLTTDADARRRAAEIGEVARTEDGVGATVAQMQRWGWLRESQPHPPV